MKTILVIDDDCDLRQSISQAVESMGYRAITAANGKEGVNKSILDEPDLVLLDVTLPDIDGPQVAKILRANPITKDFPIIAMSAAFGSSLRQSCLSAGCNDSIAKPFTYELLEQKLGALITTAESKR